MVLERPWLLVLLAALPVAIWVTSLSVTRLSRVRLGLATVLRLIGLTAMVLALAGFAGRTRYAPGHGVCRGYVRQHAAGRARECPRDY